MDKTLLVAEDRKKIYDQLLDAMIEALETTTMTSDEVAPASKYILGLDKVNSKAELLLFLQNLVSRWQPFNKVYLSAKGNQIKSIDDAKLLEVKKRMDSFITH